jgi:hypothetical protein
LWNSDNFKGASYDAPISAELKKIYYTKQETGSYYDLIQKQQITTYDYIRNEDTVDTFELTSKDGTATLSGLPISTSTRPIMSPFPEDTQGRTVTEQVYLGREYYPYYGSGDNLTLKNASTAMTIAQMYNFKKTKT